VWMVTGHRLCFLGELGVDGYWTPSLLFGRAWCGWLLDTVFAFWESLVGVVTGHRLCFWG
ncbi:hypothetical protein, partial [Bartonella callosciuri]|uniref:hypothetical protein n=1 Tax=Bartonella callosciuri TaxID=686223 RepID=UPI001AEDA003